MKAFLIITLLFISSCNVYHEVDYVSMAPFYPAALKCLISPFSYNSIRDVKKGDIVLARVISTRNYYKSISRVVGLPNDIIVLTDSSVYINGTQIEQSPVDYKLWGSDSNLRYFYEKIGADSILVTYDLSPGERYPNDTLKVPENSALLLSDRRYRRWNPTDEIIIPFERILGKLAFKF